jgi:formylglycine-generating enzyme required for sulfatase activity
MPRRAATEIGGCPWFSALFVAALVGIVVWLAGVPVGGQEAAPALNPAIVPTTEWLPPAVDLPDAVAATEAEMKAYAEVVPGSSVQFDMMPIPGGVFTMGSPDGEAGRKPSEGPQFQAQIEPFWMGRYEVKWEEYDLWGMGVDKDRRKADTGEPTEWDRLADAITMPTPPYLDMSFGMGRQGYPAICMTQFAAKVYCKWLSAKTGRYYRLPTEAEWEYACRAGSTTAYCFGDDPAQLGDYAWYFENSSDNTHPPGQKKPNAWGLYDMHGNVLEWVLDKFTADGYTVPAEQPAKGYMEMPDKEWGRVVRGGCYSSDAAELRSASRVGSVSSWKQNDPQIPQSIWYLTDAYHVGFRIVRPLNPPSAEEVGKYDVDADQQKRYETYPKSRGY